MKVKLGRTRNFKQVYYDPSNKHLATHLASHPELIDLAAQALAHISVDQDNLQINHDFTKMVGLSEAVETVEGDDVFYAKRQHRAAYSRFVTNRKPKPTSLVTLVLQRTGINYLLISAWIGESVPPFPGDRKEWPNSRSYWSNHALVYSGQTLDDSTVTKECPW